MTGRGFMVQETPLAAVRPQGTRLDPGSGLVWLNACDRARQLIRIVKPAVLEEFDEAMAVFHTRPDFAVQKFQPLLDTEGIEEIRTLIKALEPSDFALDEAPHTRRLLVHDHPCFSALQETLVQRVSEAAGEPVEAHYNFLSLYKLMDGCPVRMDSPEAKWTLELCVDQTEPWPVWFSPVQPWPEAGARASQAWLAGECPQSIRPSPELAFTRQVLEPGEAILFAGSSQWHYRDAVAPCNASSSCDLLHLHFIPAGCRELVVPANWARLFDVPELEVIGVTPVPAPMRADVPRQVASV